MSMPSTSQVIEAAKLTLSFISDAGKSLPVIWGCIAVSMFLVLVYPDGRIWCVSACSAVFFITYLIVLRHVHVQHRKYARWALIHTITKDERWILQRYLKEDRAVCYFSIFHGASASLLAKGILARVTSVFPQDCAPVSIQPYLLVYLRKHPELIGLRQEDIGATKLKDELNEYGDNDNAG
jgi:hypothetical protein